MAGSVAALPTAGEPFRMNAARAELPPAESIARDVRRALDEDIGSGDVTADLLPGGAFAQARVVTREAAVLCGAAWFESCFRALDEAVRIEWLAEEGEAVAPGALLCRLDGSARALVTGERTALNFLQTLSGTATATAAFVEAVRGTRTTILDTRKTLPGLRLAQKYAVRAGADRIMLDEFELHELSQAVAEVDGRVPLEVSGSVSLDRVRAIAETGVDFVSIGALTKHVRAIDLSMRIELGRRQETPA
jgi:nicotinate-nucleotide pyrophosphorylase (carboxylating)